MFLTESGNFGLTGYLENGTITSITGSNMVGSVESAGNGWLEFKLNIHHYMIYLIVLE